MREDVNQAAAVLRSGGLVAFPTETVYGLGADAANEIAVRRIFAVKGRPSTHPLIVHVASLEAARSWARQVPAAAERLAAAFWPGPLTIVLRRSEKAADTVTGGQDTVGLRVPAHPLALELIDSFGSGLAAPSANKFGRLSATTAAHVQSELGKEVDLVLDGGPCRVGVESSIVDLSTEAPRLLRPGGVPKEQIEEVLGREVLDASRATDMRAPGMLESHYAPRAGLVAVSAEEAVAEVALRLTSVARLALIGPRDLRVPKHVLHLPMPKDSADFARDLYAKLREADAADVDLIVAVAPEGSGLALAVRDRLRRAAAPRE